MILIYANIGSSWCCDPRPQRCGEEKDWSPQGPEKACLGQALRRLWLKLSLSFAVYPALRFYSVLQNDQP